MTLLDLLTDEHGLAISSAAIGFLIVRYMKDSKKRWRRWMRKRQNYEANGFLEVQRSGFPTVAVSFNLGVHFRLSKNFSKHCPSCVTWGVAEQHQTDLGKSVA